MKLSDFSYTNTITSELVKYSHWIPGTISLFNKSYSSSTGVICQVPCCGQSLKEDRLVYWDSGKNDITYGRYLQFKNINWEIFPFWTGFSASTNKTIYCIWFKEDDVSQYIKNLKKKPFPNAVVKNGEVWVPMNSSTEEITNQTVIDFWYSVLKELI